MVFDRVAERGSRTDEVLAVQFASRYAAAGSRQAPSASVYVIFGEAKFGCQIGIAGLTVMAATLLSRLLLTEHSTG